MNTIDAALMKRDTCGLTRLAHFENALESLKILALYFKAGVKASRLMGEMTLKSVMA